MNLSRLQYLLFAFAFVLIAASCTRYKNIEYLQEKEETKADSIGFYPREIIA